MKPEPDSSSNGKLPKPRRGFAKEKRSEDKLEKDLWDLDEPTPAAEEAPAQDGPEAASEPEKEEETIPLSSIPVAPRNSRKDLVFKQTLLKKRDIQTTSGDDNSTEAPEKEAEFTNRVISSTVSDEAFDDLENSLSGPDAEITPETATAEAETEGKPMAPVARGSGLSHTPEDDLTGDEPVALEEKPAAAPVVKPRIAKLSKLEGLGLVGFLVLLIAGSGFFFLNSVNKLPDHQKPLTSGDFPISGQKITADSIQSYWREPSTSGETVRRGTLLLPVVELGVSGGPGAVRIFFRDAEGATVGDGVTRAITGKDTITIAATAGFDDQGMFAAYRTGESKPWKIEVYEGPSERAGGNEFKKLFEIPISTQRR